MNKLRVILFVIVAACTVAGANMRAVTSSEIAGLNKTAQRQVDVYQNRNWNGYPSLMSPRMLAYMAAQGQLSIAKTKIVMIEQAKGTLNKVKYSQINYKTADAKVVDVASTVESDNQFKYGWMESSFVDSRDGVSRKITQPTLIFEEEGNWYFYRLTETTVKTIAEIYPEIGALEIPAAKIEVLKEN